FAARCHSRAVDFGGGAGPRVAATGERGKEPQRVSPTFRRFSARGGARDRCTTREGRIAPAGRRPHRDQGQPVPGAGCALRQPAGLCGLVGVKPTYGRVSRYGLIAFASSLDQIGTLTRTVEDAALILNVICGRDPLDATSSEHAVPDFAAGLERPMPGLTIG